MRSKFRVRDVVVTRVAIGIPCCDITIEKGAQGKVKDIDPDSGDLIIGLYGHYPELSHRNNIIDISAVEAPRKIERLPTRMERHSVISHLAIGGGVCAILVILLLHFNFRPAYAAAQRAHLLPRVIGAALALHRIDGLLPLAIHPLCNRPQNELRTI